MKKLTNEERREFDLLESDCFVPISQVKKENARWKKIAIVSVAFAAISIAASLVTAAIGADAAKQAKRVDVVVFRDDGNGGITVIRSLQSDTKLRVDKDIIENYTKNQLGEYVQALYSAPNSKEMKQENAYKVFYMTQKNYYDVVPRKIFQSNFAPDSTSIITVKVDNGTRISPDVWQIDWTKKLNGDEIGKFKTWITYKQEKITDVVVGGYNPLGIVVTNIDTQADLK